MIDSINFYFDTSATPVFQSFVFHHDFHYFFRRNNGSHAGRRQTTSLGRQIDGEITNRSCCRSKIDFLNTISSESLNNVEVQFMNGFTTNRKKLRIITARTAVQRTASHCLRSPLSKLEACVTCHLSL